MSVCGCLQAVELQIDSARYYPENYYSYAAAQTDSSWGWRATLRKARVAAALGHGTWLSKLVIAWRGAIQLPSWLTAIKPAFNASIIDIGSGSGALLMQLRDWGFTNLSGADPFLKADKQLGNIPIRKAYLHELHEQYDLIMLHHVFEHVPDPRELLVAAKARMQKAGTLLIRIPVTGKYAWRHYGQHWVQIDAPRHLYLHTESSMQRLADETGFAIEQIIYDSTAFNSGQ